LLRCRWPIRCQRTGTALAAILGSASWTRFSPTSRTPASHTACTASGPCVFVTARTVTCCWCPPRTTAASIAPRTSASRWARSGSVMARKSTGARIPLQGAAARRPQRARVIRRPASRARAPGTPAARGPTRARRLPSAEARAPPRAHRPRHLLDRRRRHVRHEDARRHGNQPTRVPRGIAHDRDAVQRPPAVQRRARCARCGKRRRHRPPGIRGCLTEEPQRHVGPVPPSTACAGAARDGAAARRGTTVPPGATPSP
jgi:hypothetical protein